MVLVEEDEEEIEEVEEDEGEAEEGEVEALGVEVLLEVAIELEEALADVVVPEMVSYVVTVGSSTIVRTGVCSVVVDFEPDQSSQ